MYCLCSVLMYCLCSLLVSLPINHPTGDKLSHWENALHCTALDCTALHCTALYWTELNSTSLDCTAPYCTALSCTALLCNVVRFTAARTGSFIFYIFILCSIFSPVCILACLHQSVQSYISTFEICIFTDWPRTGLPICCSP